MTLWEVDIYPSHGQADRLAQTISSEAADLGLIDELQIVAARGYLIQGELDENDVQRLAQTLLSDRVIEQVVCAPVGEQRLNQPPEGLSQLVHVLPKPGVTDPVAESTLAAMAQWELAAERVRTLRKYWIGQLPEASLELAGSKVLSNDSVEDVIVGPLEFDRIQLGAPYQFQLRQVPLRDAEEESLGKISRDWQLSLSVVEMQTIQNHFRDLQRDPTDVELETIAQTWSEHCSHKTLTGRIAYSDEHGPRQFENLLKETIFAATQQLRREWGDNDWCISVFEDNAGIVRLDEQHHAAFKVETHNRPSALEPYGGANTGIGGVIRDILGTGLGAKPVCNTDVFCFAPPDTPAAEIPPGVLHPRRVMKGVVAGVRDYGNRMGIPTVNGAIYFDRRYIGNPLVYCGTVGILPCEKSHKRPQPGDLIVALGGRTGRDGIHGATFSSAELTSESESLSGGAVQIGNAITEKMLLDVLLEARDLGWYNAVTDCGAGGFSSAVGEMGEKIGAEVWLERAPVKYEGLSYTEIWISEAQERMVCSVPEAKRDEFIALCKSENVEATVIGRFVPTGRLTLSYHGQRVADLSMKFLHDGRPPIVRQAVYSPPPDQPLGQPHLDHSTLAEQLCGRCDEILLNMLGSLNIASKEWVIRQYDHEVQGTSVIKPLVGVSNDGPSDAAVLRPIAGSHRGLVVACGMNPRYGDLDTYHMAASAIDEAIRNCVAVGADPQRIAILDNFCWGHTDRPETLGSLVRAAMACHDVAIELKTPFISGKDSLHNEFSFTDENGHRQTISIPPSLLISAMGQVDDMRRCVTMDFKQALSAIYVVGQTKRELGGSHLALVEGLQGGAVPQVDAAHARQVFAAMHRAIASGAVRACHDASEGGLAVAIAEMTLAGGLGAEIDLGSVPTSDLDDDPNWQRLSVLFAESNSRFVCEVAPDQVSSFEAAMSAVPHARIGQVTQSPQMVVRELLRLELADLKEAWQAPLRW